MSLQTHNISISGNVWAYNWNGFRFEVSRVLNQAIRGIRREIKSRVNRICKKNEIN